MASTTATATATTPYPDLADAMAEHARAILADDAVRPSIRERLAALMLTQAACLREGVSA
ncbi:hypothetical protein ACPPVO_08205 [Dactylosporangium sp. McL0621]|uniref:hypothetical protein n=1 Tax=Dactylosporangium sp. McL0621 TaxID=3415678 RepID=UPI003CFA31D3